MHLRWPPFWFGVSRGWRAWIMSAVVKSIGGHWFRWGCKQGLGGRQCQRMHGHPMPHRSSDGIEWRP